MVSFWRPRLVLLAALVAAAPAFLWSEIRPPRISSLMSGSIENYLVNPGDTLATIASRVGVDGAVIAEQNGLSSNTPLSEGQHLVIDNRHIVPAAHDDVTLLINVAQRMLFFLEGGGLAAAYPVGLGRPDWPTSLGDFRVMTREEHPTWDVPVSIQEEMRRHGRQVVTTVAPGPGNPLGQFWIGLTLPSLGIHGTDAPTSVYRHLSHGCIRMLPEHIATLFSRVTVGTKGRTVYEPVLLARSGHLILVEVHRDVYRLRPADSRPLLVRAAESVGLKEHIDWAAVDAALEKKQGIAIPIGKAPDSGRCHEGRSGHLRRQDDSDDRCHRQ